MKIHSLAPEFRANLKRLLQGFAEHCEISDRLSGRIERPLYFHGFKFGAPVFAFEGPPLEGAPHRTIGLIGHNRPNVTLASDIVLQLIEVATLRPELATGQRLRLLPVSDPVTLELGEDAPDGLAEWDVLRFVVDEFRASAVDGLIEVVPTEGKALRIDGSADIALFQVLASSVGADPRGLPSRPDISSVVPATDRERWHLRIEVPSSWNHAGEILAVSRFIGRVLETYAHLAASCVFPCRRIA